MLSYKGIYPQIDEKSTLLLDYVFFVWLFLCLVWESVNYAVSSWQINGNLFTLLLQKKKTKLVYKKKLCDGKGLCKYLLGLFFY